MGDGRSEFCELEHRRLVGSLTLYTGNADLAHELAQEALTRACLHWGRVSMMAAPGAWVHRVAINLANSRFRRRRLERRHSEATTPGLPDLRDEDDLANALAVRSAVTSLPARQRAALVLRYFADMSVADTATTMGCAEGTVKALTSQAMEGLRSRLGADRDAMTEER